MQPEQISGRSRLARWLGLLLLSAVFVAVLELLRLPAALLLGPMLAAILFAAGRLAVQVPTPAIAVSQALIGCLMAKAIPVSILAEMARDWPIFLAGVVSVIVAAATLGYLLARFHVLPGTTAIWGSMPGGASAMTIMAGAYGADMRLVAFMQYLRVVCVAVAASSISRIWVGSAHGTEQATMWFPPIAVLPAIETAALVAVSLVATRLLRFQAGALLLPLVLGLLFQSLGLLQIELPPWLLAISYAVIGWTIGIRFNRDIIAHAARALPQVFGAIVILIAICCVFAAVLVYTTGVDPLTAYLATSPGGADSVAIIASSTHVDVPFIMAMQLSRFLVIVLIGPKLAQLMVRLAGFPGPEIQVTHRDPRRG